MSTLPPQGVTLARPGVPGTGVWDALVVALVTLPRALSALVSRSATAVSAPFRRASRPAAGRGGALRDAATGRRSPRRLHKRREVRDVAVLIATRNGSRSLGDTIASALGQAPVFVVSDASDDDTAEVARRAGAQVLALRTNVGKPTALYHANKHFRLTKRFAAIVILDDDTIIEPGFIASCRQKLVDGVAIVVGRTVTNWKREYRWNPWVGVRAYSYWKYQLLVRRGQSALNVMNCISGSNSMYRSTVLDQVLTLETPYIVDDTYWTLEAHRRGLGRIVYAPRAKALILDPLNGRDWYKQNLRWLWGTLQGVRGHRIGTQATRFDVMYVLLILDWVLYVLVWPIWLGVVVWFGRDHWQQLLALYVAGYLVWTIAGAIALRQWRMVLLTPFVIAFDWLYRINFLHAVVKTVRQPRVTSCRWDSPARFTEAAPEAPAPSTASTASTAPARLVPTPAPAFAPALQGAAA